METYSPFRNATKTHPSKLKLPSLKITNAKPIITTNNYYSSLITTTIDPIKKLLRITPQTIDHTQHVIKKTKADENRPSLANRILNALDDFVNSKIDLPFHPSIDPKIVLSNNFAPVDELPPTACTVVEGSLPRCLDGVYVRNGPNPQFTPTGTYHYLDGDGMLHLIKITRGKATFCSRYVRTHKYETEREIGRPIAPNFFACFNGRVLPTLARLTLVLARVAAGQFDPANRGFGVANTSVALLGGRLFALCESDLPYEVKVTEEGDLVTVGRHDFHSSEAFSRMTAHPKVDRETGETFCYEYDVFRPFLTFFRIDFEGRKRKGIPIFSVGRCTAIHDFAVTENYIVFCDGGIVVDPSRVLRGGPPVGVDFGRTPRLGIVGKYAVDGGGTRWFEAPGFNMLHCANCWEEGGGAGGMVVMVASNIGSAESILEIADSPRMTLEKVRIGVGERTVERRALSGEFLDFAALVGVVKLDLTLADESGRDCTVARRLYGPGCSGGEPFFVPRQPENPTAEEDDGYVITYAHDENTRESKFLVMDAKSPTLDLVAAVKLPQRVPNGIHGLFVSEKDLKRL
ncbi:carotenoid cleavage dioxygenase 4 [Striga asiatica]|uniref:Carotenoid cleavage dioxygenase 4 n=1 Tax=Striga asiatica TaxID=4170 RepID=A0A5A7P1V6_STRAF|nr:carotenoid cleavage dioxygenase 4 [Striga asiatica]